MDRAALEKFVGMCCARYAEQTHGKEWKGNVADLEGPKLLTRLIGKRIKAAAAHAPSAQAACEWYGRVNKVKDVPTMAGGLGPTHFISYILSRVHVFTFRT